MPFASAYEPKSEATLGIVGGMTWRSSLEYYRLASELGCTRIMLSSLDFGELLAELEADRPDRVGTFITDAARTLETAGADPIVLAANTAHRWFAQVAAAVSCPIVHIADPVLDAAAADGLSRLGLLATSSTIESGVYARAADHAIEIRTPRPDHQRDLDDLILTGLTHHTAGSAECIRLAPMLHDLMERGTQAVVLGCTELHPLAAELARTYPVLDTAALHVGRAVDLTLRGTVHDGGK